MSHMFTLRYADSLDLSNTEAKFTISNWIPGEGIKWMRVYWHRSIFVSLAYIITIFTLKYFMRNRSPYNLRVTLFAWNIMLAVFSLIGSIFMLSEMFTVLPKGAYKAICFATDNYRTQYWIWLFAVSKLVELGDTLFIVLRKQNLIILHWSHHALTLIFTWYAVGQNISLGRWFVTMNYFVHTFMYAYYAARAARIQISKPISASITVIQMLQLAIGFYVSYYVLQVKLAGNYCESSTGSALFGSLLYMILLYMFAKFFVHAYIPNAKKFVFWSKVLSKSASDAKVNDIVKAS